MRNPRRGSTSSFYIKGSALGFYIEDPHRGYSLTISIEEQTEATSIQPHAVVPKKILFAEQNIPNATANQMLEDRARETVLKL